MKKSKKALRLDKLVISKLNNNHTIMGGSGECPTGDIVDIRQSEITPQCKRPTKDVSCFLTMSICLSNNLDC